MKQATAISNAIDYSTTSLRTDKISGQRQGVLFSEPSIAETGVWCELSDGIDPAQWAGLCRHIGSLNPQQFSRVKDRVLGNPDSLLARVKRIFTFDPSECKNLPLLQIGYIRH